MPTELERGLKCVAALSQLHAYIQEKDLGGECTLRVDVRNTDKEGVRVTAGPRARINFYFEFPQEYSSMCTQVYYPEAVAFTKDIDDATVELMTVIQVQNRLREDPTDIDKCGIVFEMSHRFWRDSISHILGEVQKPLAEAFNSHVLDPLQQIADDISAMMYDFVSIIHEATSVSAHTGSPISDDPDEDNYREVRDWGNAIKKEYK